MSAMLKAKGAEQRISMRFNKVFPVVIGSELHGETRAVARNISAGGMMVEMADPLPLGCIVTVHFRIPESSAEFVARAEVKHQYCFNYSVSGEPSLARGIGLRFAEFIQETGLSLERQLTRRRVLH
jgi:hypothetical protein